MTKQDMIDALLAGIKVSDADMKDTVTISKGTASEILSLLIRSQDAQLPTGDEDGKVLFYCADCGQSFRAVPREDKDCYDRWKYHRWFANCPRCKAEVVQNDRYWR